MDVKFVSIKHLTSPVVDEAEEVEDLAAEEATMLPELVVKEDMAVVDTVSDENDLQAGQMSGYQLFSANYFPEGGGGGYGGRSQGKLYH
jgi:translation initiation factor RLI1